MPGATLCDREQPSAFRGRSIAVRRRVFLSSTVAGLAPFALLGCRSAESSSSSRPTSGWDLAPAFLELAPGFRAMVLQRAGDPFHDGHHMGAQPDGMACLPGRDGSWVLLRNHELGDLDLLAALEAVPWVRPPASPAKAFSQDVYGGVSRLVLDPKGLRKALAGRLPPSAAITGSNAVLVGTDRNCAGGVLDRDGRRAWVSCEESDRSGHGWAFLTYPDDDVLTPAAPRCLRSWGRFQREGIAQDPKRGAIYMSEDHAVGLLYRFVPRDPRYPEGEGELWALSIEGLSHTDPHVTHDPTADPHRTGTTWDVQWVKIPDPVAALRRCRDQGAQAGATAFNRVEGIAFDGAQDRLYFVASTAGPLQAGQVFAYAPGDDRLVLVAQVEDRSKLSMPDNIAIAPWGDLVLAEDNYDRRGAHSQYVRGMRPDGSVYDILRNRDNEPHGTEDLPPGAEFAGCCFSPDGTVLFVNVQGPQNVTLAVAGDWSTLRTAGAFPAGR